MLTDKVSRLIKLSAIFRAFSLKGVKNMITPPQNVAITYDYLN